MKNIEVKQAMIMAAGMGTRLKPWTDMHPKALLTYQGKPLLEHVINRLVGFGFEKIIINVHHFGTQIIDFISNLPTSDTELIISDERNQLLDTGGGIRRAAGYFHPSPVLVHNVDILSDIDLDAFWIQGTESSSIATLAVKERKTTRPLLFDEQLQLCGWKNIETGEKRITRHSLNYISLAFSGIYILRPDFIDLLPNNEVFPVMPEILNISENHLVTGYRHDSDQWKDMGKRESFL